MYNIICQENSSQNILVQENIYKNIWYKKTQTQKSNLKLTCWNQFIEIVTKRLKWLKTNKGQKEQEFESLVSKTFYENQKLVSATISSIFKEKNYSFEMRNPTVHFGRTPDSVVESAKVKYLNCITDDINIRTKCFLSQLKRFEITHKPQSVNSLKKNLNLLKLYIPSLLISETLLKWDNFITTSQICSLDTPLKKTTWICKENRVPNLQNILLCLWCFP